MKLISPNVTRSIGRQILKTKKNSPHIFFVGGVVGVVGSAVLACKATLKLERTLDEIKRDLEDVKTIKDSKEKADEGDLQNLGYVLIKSGTALGKLYGPSVIIGGLSIAALTGSHIQLTKRNAALSATLAIVSKAYDDYRIRVQEEIGKDRELDIHRAITKEETEVNGKKKSVKMSDPNKVSPYARWFDVDNPNWRENLEINQVFLQCQQNYANDLLHARGHLFLNEVYTMLGYEHTTPGAVVGWIIDGEGDNHVDFGIYEAGNIICKLDENQIVPSIILDFNVDGEIYKDI